MYWKNIPTELWGFGAIGKLIPRTTYELFENHQLDGNYPEICKVITRTGTPNTIARDFNTDSDYQFPRWDTKMYAESLSDIKEKAISIGYPKKLFKLNSSDPSAFKVKGVQSDTYYMYSSKNSSIIDISNENIFERTNSKAKIIVNSTGISSLKTYQNNRQFLKGNAEYMLLTCPPKDSSIPEIIVGVNDIGLEKRSEKVFSTGSCSGNCMIPLVNFAHNKYTIKHGFVSVPTHGPTASQATTDQNNVKKPERGRSSFNQSIFTSTGCIDSLFRVIPDLTSKILPKAYSIRNEGMNSAVCIDLILEKNISIDQFFKDMRDSDLYKRNIISINDNAILTPKDIAGTHSAGVINPRLCYAENFMLRIVAYFDNRYGFTSQLSRLLNILANNIS